VTDDYDAYPEPDHPVPGNPSFRTEGSSAQFSLAEYDSVRGDCLQGLSGQQSILAWSIAAIGVLFAAGLAVNPSHVDHATTIRPLIFLLGIPAITFGASVAWLGEIFRMERDAHYLRLLERATWVREQKDSTPSDAWIGRTPLLYNSWVAHGEPRGRNRVYGYLGGLLIYTGAISGSLVLACVLVRHNHLLVIVIAATLLAAYVALTVVQVLRILTYSKLEIREAARRAASSTAAQADRAQHQ
jgi:hypothetical protein